MKKKHPKALTATRVRYEVRPIIFGKIQCRSFVGARKEAAMKCAKNDSPAVVTDTMARIGSPQVWRVDETGIHLMRHRQT